MLPKSHRLNLKKDFKFVQAGKRAETASFRLLWRSGENPQPLIGIALTKKAFKGAVERNRARRLTSTAIQALYHRLRKDLNLVIMPKGKILAQSAKQLTQELEDVKDLYLSD